MGELGALFNPGMRHELEERQAKAARREEEGNARDGDLRIDLESGVAVINIPGADQEQADETQPDEAQEATQEPPASEDDAAHVGTRATAEDAQAEDDAPAAPPVLRPRGKRGLSASHR